MLIVVLVAAIIVVWLLSQNKSNNNENIENEQSRIPDQPLQKTDVQESAQEEKAPPADHGANTATQNESGGIQVRSQTTSPVANRGFLTPHQQESERIKEGILDNMEIGVR